QRRNGSRWTSGPNATRHCGATGPSTPTTVSRSWHLRGGDAACPLPGLKAQPSARQGARARVADIRQKGGSLAGTELASAMDVDSAADARAKEHGSWLTLA